MECFLAACGDKSVGSDAVAHGPGAVCCEFLHQEVVVAALDLEYVFEPVHAVEEALAVGEVVAGAGER